MNDKLRMASENVTKTNISKIAELFPSCVTEGINDKGQIEQLIDFDALKAELSDCIIANNGERYQISWPGKSEAKLLSNSPIQLCLRPCPHEEGVEWENTKNLYIKGDNLDVLKILRETYREKIKMIYIDPPYNTGKDSFVYGDNYRLTLEEYSELHGDYSEEGYRLTPNLGTNGPLHTDWLNMIYPRLRLAHDLLSKDGAIFIHIDEHEVSSLQLVCREIFGERNEQGTIVWDKRNPKGSVSGVAYQHEYILVYSKNSNEFVNSHFSKTKEHAELMIEKAKAFIKKYGGVNDSSKSAFKQWIKDNSDILSGGERAYCLLDPTGRVYRPVSMAAPDKPETRSHRPLIHPVTGKPCPVPEKGWRFKDDAMDDLLKKGKIEFGPTEKTQPNQKYFLDENMTESFSSLIYYGGSDDLVGQIFDNPKPQYICRKLIDSICREDKNAIVMDFFAGSSSTAQAVMSLNAEDNGNRQFIMIQIPEECKETSEAFKAGYKTICDLGIDRIRRAGAEIKKQNAQRTIEGSNYQIDVGFRVFRLDTSNMENVYYTPEETTQTKLDDLVDNVKKGRTPEDLLTQAMLECSIPLSATIKIEPIDGHDVFVVNKGELVACFDVNISEKIVEFIAKNAISYAIIRDGSIDSDSTATNFEQIFKTYNTGVIRRVL